MTDFQRRLAAQCVISLCLFMIGLTLWVGLSMEAVAWATAFVGWKLFDEKMQQANDDLGVGGE